MRGQYDNADLNSFFIIIFFLFILVIKISRAGGRAKYKVVCDTMRA